MVGRTNVGGGHLVTAAWAYIGVTYPAGSVCTATNGALTFTAEDTSGLYVFQIPQPLSTPESWTISSTNGTKNKSATVSLNSQYQFETVTLRYSRLPEGYQEVEYLESSGTQHIDLGYTTDLQSLEHEITFMNLSSGASVFGNNNTSSTLVQIGRTTSNSPWTVEYYYINTLASGAYHKGDKISVVVNNSSRQIVEEDSVLTTITGTGGSARLIMFGVFSGGGNIAYCNARIYEYKQTNFSTNTVNYNLVPCYRESDDVAGFYDLANSAFITNAGTGTFEVGPDV